MDLHRLEIFCRVVELGSFSKAAEASLLSQPTVSEHIKNLEEIFGEKLLDRLGREILPTQAGRILYRYGKKMLRLQKDAFDEVSAHKNDLSGSLAIGASTIPGNYIFPGIIGAFKKQYPSVQLALKILNTGQVTQIILDGEIEIGVVGSLKKNTKLIFEEIFSDELILAVHPKHKFAKQNKVRMDDLRNEHFILRQQGSGTLEVTRNILKKYDFSFSQVNVVAEVATTEAVRQCIKAGIGISILSNLAVTEDLKHKSLRAIPISGIRIKRPFYLVRRKGKKLSPLCVSFIKFLRNNN